MSFASLAFAVFLPLVFIVYWSLSAAPLRRQNLFVLAASYLFYGWWDERFLLLIVASSITDYWVGLALHRQDSEARRKLLLLTSVVVNLGILGTFKYFDFFAGSLADLAALAGVRLDTVTLDVVLPVGISFYTFQTLSYTIDIYRRRMRPTNDLVAFFAYVAFFPQLVAGPIERARNLLPQFESRRSFSESQASSGLRLMLWGFFKKLVIADGLAPFVDVAFGAPGEHTGLVVLLAAIAFAIQVYGDFSGYSDIAIGAARLFGFELMVNFKTPYFSRSMRELWTRWHISLSTWLRDYVYVALDGNRRYRRMASGEGSGAILPTTAWVLTLVTTFTLSGLWHGANLTFVVWGFLHGLVMSAEVVATRRLGVRLRLPAGLQVAFTFMLFSLLGILFRARTLGEAGVHLRGIFIDGGGQAGLEAALVAAYPAAAEPLYLLLSLVLFLATEIAIGTSDADQVFRRLARPLRWLGYYVLVAWILLFGQLQAPPQFVYFQF